MLQFLEQLRPGAGYQLQSDLWKALMEFCQQWRQAPASAGFDGADAQDAAGFGLAVDRPFGLIHQGQDALAVAEKDFPVRTDFQPTAGADKQAGAQLAFQLLEAVGDVGGHAMQLFGRSGNAAGAGDRFHHFQLAQFHCSFPVRSGLSIR